VIYDGPILSGRGIAILPERVTCLILRSFSLVAMMLSELSPYVKYRLFLTSRGQTFPELPIINRGGNIVVIRGKSYKPSETLDEGEWLRPLMASVRERVQSLPDSEIVDHIRGQVFYEIARESIPLVA
jgi:hypothetical protein